MRDSCRHPTAVPFLLWFLSCGEEILQGGLMLQQIKKILGYRRGLDQKNMVTDIDAGMGIIVMQNKLDFANAETKSGRG